MMDVPNNYHILIVGDSRVRGLASILSRTSLNLSFRVECLPGAKLERIMIKVLTCIAHKDDYDLIFLTGGDKQSDIFEI